MEPLIVTRMSPPFRLALLAALVLATAAEAASIYRCQGSDGLVLFSGQPCPPWSEGTTPGPSSPPGSLPEAGTKEQQDTPDRDKELPDRGLERNPTPLGS
jgi:hypothetical protein